MNTIASRLALSALSMAVAAMFAAPAAAALPTGTLSFINPTGTVNGDEDIEVWLRLTIDAGSAPLLLDSSAPNRGLGLADVSTVKQQFVSIDYAGTNTFFVCSGSFTNVCDPGAYSFNFNTTGPNAFNNRADISLAPGASMDYLFGTFTPVGGVAAPGNYQFYGSGATFFVDGQGYQAVLDSNGDVVLGPDNKPVYQQALDEQGNPLFDTVQKPVFVQLLDANGDALFDAQGNPVYEQAVDEFGAPLLDAQGQPIYVQATDAFGDLLFTDVQVPRLALVPLQSIYFDIAQTNCGPDPWNACAGFTRDVLAVVPEPASYALMSVGLLMVVGAARRQLTRRSKLLANTRSS